MDKGIRPACNAKFLELLPTRQNTREGNTAFRKSVIAFVMEQYGATLASAATHYNHAFIAAREAAKTNETLAAQLLGLGRAEDKKGGRKKVIKPTAPSVIPQPVNALLQNFINAGAITPPAQITAAAAAVGLEGLQEQQEEAGEESSDDAPQGGDEAPVDDTPAVTLYTVFKVVKGTEVAKDLTEEQADELIAKAAAAKKSKLDKRAQ
jgi:hypothetical protein